MLSKRTLMYVVCALSVALLPWRAALGQVNTGNIGGTVRDPSGAVLVGADVTARNVATGAVRTAKTGNVGQYNLRNLPVGTYEITVSAANFSAYKTNAEVTVGGFAPVDAQLGTAKAATTVEVVGEAGGTEVNTQTQELSQLVNPEQLTQLPSLTRNPYDFVAISGNVSNGDSTTPNTTGMQNQFGRGVGYSINGQRMSGTGVLMDGVDNTDIFNANVGQQIPIDSVEEYRVITNNADTLYGRSAGGTVNLVTKSGTNAFHGSLWEFNRLSAYTANTATNDAINAKFLQSGATGPLPAPKGTYTRNQFGFAIGGPVIKDKLFFYASGEWLRVRSQATETQEVLNPSFISVLPSNVQSYFNAFGKGVAAPPTASVTVGQLATAGLTVSPINGASPLSPTQPVFDVTNFKANFDAGGDIPQNTYRIIGRLDYNLNDQTQMFFRYGREDLVEFPGAAFLSVYPAYDVGQTTLNNSYLYSLNHTFSPTMLSNTKLSFTRLNVLAATYNTALQSVPNLMLTGFPTDPATGILIQFPGLENIAPGLGGLPFGGPQNTIQVQEDLAKTKGRHSIRFGGQYTYIQLNKTFGAYAQAVEQLGGTLQDGMNSLVNAAGNPGGSPLVSFAARLNPNGAVPCNANPAFWSTSDPTQLQVTPACSVNPPLGAADYSRSYRYHDWALYAQDSFKVTPRLTLNYGVRYEHYGVQRNADQALDWNFYPASGGSLYQNTRNGLLFNAPHSPVGGFWAPNWGTVAPRIGFAFDVFGDGTTALRGGAGIGYERNFGNVTFNASFNPTPSAVLNSVCAPGQVPCSTLVSNNDLGPLSMPGPSQPLPPTELRAPDSHISTAQTQFWSLDVQRRLARNTVFEIGYSGAHGIHLYDIENTNLIGSGNLYLGDNTSNALCAGFTPVAPTNPNLCLTRANSQFSNINVRGSRGNSAYNALNVRLQTQNLHDTGLSLTANYTYAHSLDDLSSTFSDSLQGGSGAIGTLGYTNALNPKLDWGSSDFDLRNRVAVSPVWESPWFKSGKGYKTQTLGGWTVSGVFTARTGTPFSIYDYTDNLNLYTIPRLTPATAITSYRTGGGQLTNGPNLYNLLNVPVPSVTGPLDPALGISDFGPFPAGMTHRNSFRGPGAWTTDVGVSKIFKLTERVGLEFRAEGFNIFNHHNMYVNTSNLDYSSQGPGATLATGSTFVTGQKGGLGSTALGGNHDERRFGQFALKLNF